MSITQQTLTKPRAAPRARRGAIALSVLALGVLTLGGCDVPDNDPMAPMPVLGHPAYIVVAADHKYTLDGDFDQGTLVNLNHTAPNNNQLQLNTLSGTFPFIWISMSQRCTIVKINTQTGAILGEYRTIADGVGCSQSSRTTVALDGSVWVGHRGAGGVTHVGLAELNQCVDRNANGVIDTSAGYGDVKAWPGATSVVANAQDECILHHPDTGTLGFSDTRHMSIDASNKLWVGDYGTKQFVRVNGLTGAFETAPRSFGCGGYGGLIDKNGVIWSANGGSYGLLRWDPNAPDSGTNPRCINIPVYGLAVDPNGYIWVGDLYNNAVRKVSPDGNTILGPYAHGSYYAQGLASDRNGHIWVSSSLFCSSSCTVGHLLNDGTFVGNVSTPTGSGSTGVAVDADGKIWTANLNSNTAVRIDPTLGGLGGGGATLGAVDLTVSFPATTGRPLPYPYNYSDMTGAQLLSSTSPQGSWTVVQDGGAAGTPWGTITWNTEAQGSKPAGTDIIVEARAADSQAGLGAQTYITITNGALFTLTGQFIQVRVTLKAAPDGTSPVLSDLRIQGAQADAVPPACVLTGTGTNSSGQKYIQVTTRDLESGLASIVVTKAVNLSANVPAFTVGTTNPIVVTATKINQLNSSVLGLRVTDVAGNIKTCDPVDVTVQRVAGEPESFTFTGILATERWVDIQNGDPGLTNVSILVNGKQFSLAGLQVGEARTIDVGSALKAGSNNEIVVEARGKPGGSAWVLVHD